MMKKKEGVIKRGLFSIFIASMSAKAFSTDWEVGFDAPSRAEEMLLIDLPDDLDIETVTRLAVELDGIDITSLLSFSGRDLSFQPVGPMAAGAHQLRLLVIQPDGSAAEKASWLFDITDSDEQASLAKAEAWLRSASFRANTLTEFSRRITNKNVSTIPKRDVVTGGGNASASLDGGNWQFNARGNYLLQSDKAAAPTGNALDIGEYTLSADHIGERYNSGVTLGHHDVGLDSLLFSSFNRRGLSGRVASKNERIESNVFAFRSQSQIGVNDFTGLSVASDQVQGGSVSVKPFSTNQDALKVTTLYYRGERTRVGLGVGDVDEVASGSGWGAIAEKTFINGRVNVKGEYAHSRYDLDGKQGAAPEDDSEAVSLWIQGVPLQGATLLDTNVDMVIAVSYERIDTFFQSLANQGIAADRETVALVNNLYWGSFSSAVQLTHETNNVDKLLGVPTDEWESFSWSSGYAFDTQVDRRDWLGTPYLNFDGFISGVGRNDTPIGYTGIDTDNNSTSTTLGGGSNYESWNWSASHTYAEFDDHVTIGNDTISNNSSVSIGGNFNDGTYLTGGVQYSAVSRSDGDSNYNTNLNLGINTELVKDKLDLSLNYNLNLDSSNGDSRDEYSINGELAWTIRPVSDKSPGFVLALKGALENDNGNTTITGDGERYQAFITFRMLAPFTSSY